MFAEVPEGVELTDDGVRVQLSVELRWHRQIFFTCCVAFVLHTLLIFGPGGGGSTLWLWFFWPATLGWLLLSRRQPAMLWLSWSVIELGSTSVPVSSVVRIEPADTGLDLLDDKGERLIYLPCSGALQGFLSATIQDRVDHSAHRPREADRAGRHSS